MLDVGGDSTVIINPIQLPVVEGTLSSNPVLIPVATSVQNLIIDNNIANQSITDNLKGSLSTGMKTDQKQWNTVSSNTITTISANEYQNTIPFEIQLKPIGSTITSKNVFASDSLQAVRSPYSIATHRNYTVSDHALQPSTIDLLFDTQVSSWWLDIQEVIILLSLRHI